MMLKAASPSTTSFDASCHVSDAASEFVYDSTCVVAGHRSLDGGARPAAVALPQGRVPLRPDGGEQDGLEQVLVRPLLADDERDDTRSLRLLQRRDELSPRLRRRADAGVLEDLRVVPEHVRAVDVHRHRVELALVRDLVEELPGHDLAEAGLPVQGVERLQVTGLDVVLQLRPGVTLERVRRVVGRQPLGEHGLRVRARRRRRRPR